METSESRARDPTDYTSNNWTAKAPRIARPVSNDSVNSIRVLTTAAYGSRNLLDPTPTEPSASGRLPPVTGTPSRPSKRRLAAALAAVSMVAAACGGGETEVAEPTTEATTEATSAASTESAGGVIPQLDFTASELAGAGGMIDGGDFEGTDLVVWFWAPW